MVAALGEREMQSFFAEVSLDGSHDFSPITYLVIHLAILVAASKRRETTMSCSHDIPPLQADFFSPPQWNAHVSKESGRSICDKTTDSHRSVQPRNALRATRCCVIDNSIVELSRDAVAQSASNFTAFKATSFGQAILRMSSWLLQIPDVY